MFSIKKEEKWVKISLAIILGLFFIINLYSVLKYGELNYLGSFEKFDNDDVKYIRSAWELIDNGHFIYHRVNEPTVFIMPGLTYTIAFFMKIFGKFGGITAFRVFQAFLQMGSMYFLFLIGRKIFNSKAALIGCILNLLYVVEYFTATLVLTETIFKFLLLLLVYISICAVEEKNMMLYTIGGVVWGLACLVRPTIAAYPIVILVMWIIKKYSFKEIMKYTIATTLVFSLIMAPWWIRNYKEFHRFIPLTLSSGNPFLQGTYVNYQDDGKYIPYEAGETAIESNQNEINAGLYRLKTYGREEPLRYIYWYTIGKSAYLWGHPFYWISVLGISYNTVTKYHHIVLLLGIVSTVILFRRKEKMFLYLFLTTLFFNLIYLPYFTFARYSYPVMPMICTIGGYVIHEILVKRRLRSGEATNTNS
ncbi:Dolichyl-phosphate-mannose-protein mannosyltransferase [Clostridium amylolyticum]|uniref:Dolichyl-phosphate-mannose-protein mannosyltransferase n=1 Tax=Clostridium amylolyticum TaxID=1121298 RepID=A0A1M6FHK4_9CLOT|nr:glycosyltransferase family 39 protein [Clostridium amylolyticum]SHI97109.1 Dolichyl-phosphate-mannose-protein mannosyltransferase [Clostridium amylolyticum]